MRNFPEYISSPIEKIYPFIRPPWWTPQITVHIEPNKELAKKYLDDTITRHSNDLKTLCIYTDGSSINRKVGAAAYTKEITKKQNLGKDSDYNVFARKLTAIDLGIHIIKEANYT